MTDLVERDGHEVELARRHRGAELRSRIEVEVGLRIEGDPRRPRLERRRVEALLERGGERRVGDAGEPRRRRRNAGDARRQVGRADEEHEVVDLVVEGQRERRVIRLLGITNLDVRALGHCRKIVGQETPPDPACALERLLADRIGEEAGPVVAVVELDLEADLAELGLAVRGRARVAAPIGGRRRRFIGRRVAWGAAVRLRGRCVARAAAGDERAAAGDQPDGDERRHDARHEARAVASSVGSCVRGEAKRTGPVHAEGGLA